MKAIAVRLTEGADLFEEIKKLAEKNSVEAGVILSAVGSLSKSNIRLPIIDDKIKYINPSDLEIDALQGTVPKNGYHLHIVVSDATGKTYGGHLKEGCIIRTTCELVIGILENTKFTRQPDPTTGYRELSIS